MPSKQDDKQYMTKKHDTIDKIIENYKNLERSLVNQLLLETPDHYPTTGSYRETVWKTLFEQIIPRKFCIDQGVFIIDSFGQISHEVDLAIFDEQYTPYIFNYGKIKFIPIEAVAVVIQCKSNSLNKADLEEWAKSIEELKASFNSVARVMQGVVENNIEKIFNSVNSAKETDKARWTKSQTSTRPIKILCSTTKDTIPKSICDLFDISLSIQDGRLKKVIPKEQEKYEYWYLQLNHYDLKRFGEDSKKYRDIVKATQSPVDKDLTCLRIDGKGGRENVIMSLIFQLNQMLMFINNPMLFPHESYAEMFRKKILEKENNTSDRA